MFITNNPFAQLNTEMPNFFTPELMKGYVMLMVLFVIGGVLFDIWHKKSAKYFFEHSKNQEKLASRQVTSSEKTSMMVETLTNEVLTSGEFSNPQSVNLGRLIELRRNTQHIDHLMYHFVGFPNIDTR